MATTPEDMPPSDATTQETIAPAPVATRSAPRWQGWLGNFVLGGSVIVIAIGLISLTLARYDIIGKLPGFIGFMSMLIPAAVIAGLAVLALIVAKVRKTGRTAKPLLGLVLSLGLLGVMYFAVIRPAGAAPALHDITTNVDNPPQFTALPLREDNLIPFDNIEQWKAAHREGYPDIAPVLINRTPTEVLAAARALAEAKGWTVANVDQQAMQVEATAYAGYLRFHDNVIVKVTPVVDGSSRVDMRSTSEVGLSDLGYNAARIHVFLADLQAATA
jgi:uncharacterized protein (DUF1499 family)